MNTPTKRFPVPECIKAIVVSDIRDNYEFLVGQFDGKAGKTRDKRAKILQGNDPFFNSRPSNRLDIRKLA